MNFRKWIFIFIVGLCPNAHSSELPELQSFLKNFMTHIKLGEYELANKYVIPEDRDQMKYTESDLESKPPIPDELEIEIKLEGNESFFIIKNWDPYLKIKLIHRNQQWWVADG